MLRERLIPPPDIFPAEPWAAGAKGLDPKLAWEFAGQAETMFALSNGYLGIRGMPEEGRPVREPGVLLNGFYAGLWPFSRLAGVELNVIEPRICR